MKKILDGESIAEFTKERHTKAFRGAPQKNRKAHLLILKDHSDPVIDKYVELKRQYGADVGVDVTVKTTETASLESEIEKANKDENIDGIIVQLPLKLPLEAEEKIEEILNKIAPEKDVDGLGSKNSNFTSATAEAIMWLLAGHNVELKGKRIAIIGQGRLVGKSLGETLKTMKVDFDVFVKRDCEKLVKELPKYDIIITATGVVGLIKPEMLQKNAVVIDAGTTSEDGALLGDLDESVRERDDLTLTPRVGGVGPLTVAILFDHLLRAYNNLTF